MPATPAIILLSGGLDSATVLALARSQGRRCLTLTFDYGQRHRHELTAARVVARALGAAEHRTIVLDPRAFAGSALTSPVPPAFAGSAARVHSPGVEPPMGVGGLAQPDEAMTRQASTFVDGSTPVSSSGAGVPAVPKGRDEAAMGAEIPVTYVPARNLVFLSIAVATAESIGATDIFIGVNAVDYSGYPDCRPAFIAAMQQAARLGTRAGVEAAADHPLTIRTPLIDMSKAEIIRLGASLGVDFALTTSCYDPQGPLDAPLACGSCDACILRRRGFEQAGVSDPTRYAPRAGGAA